MFGSYLGIGRTAQGNAGQSPLPIRSPSRDSLDILPPSPSLLTTTPPTLSTLSAKPHRSTPHHTAPRPRNPADSNHLRTGNPPSRYSAAQDKATPSTKCQKCLKLGHYSFTCTNQPFVFRIVLPISSILTRRGMLSTYKARPTRTAILKNPKLKTKLTASLLPPLDDLLPSKFVPRPSHRSITHAFSIAGLEPQLQSLQRTNSSEKRNRNRNPLPALPPLPPPPRHPLPRPLDPTPTRAQILAPNLDPRDQGVLDATTIRANDATTIPTNDVGGEASAAAVVRDPRSDGLMVGVGNEMKRIVIAKERVEPRSRIEVL